MKYFIVSFLLLAILLQIFSKMVIYIDYKINMNYIIMRYCVNKNNPAAHCNGKCHLMKQLKNDDNQQKTPGNNLKVKVEIQLFPINEKISHFNVRCPEEFNFPPLITTKPNSPSFPIFHPPGYFS